MNNGSATDPELEVCVSGRIRVPLKLDMLSVLREMGMEEVILEESVRLAVAEHLGYFDDMKVSFIHDPSPVEGGSVGSKSSPLNTWDRHPEALSSSPPVETSAARANQQKIPTSTTTPTAAHSVKGIGARKAVVDINLSGLGECITRLQATFNHMVDQTQQLDALLSAFEDEARETADADVQGASVEEADLTHKENTENSTDKAPLSAVAMTVLQKAKAMTTAMLKDVAVSVEAAVKPRGGTIGEDAISGARLGDVAAVFPSSEPGNPALETQLREDASSMLGTNHMQKRDDEIASVNEGYHAVLPFHAEDEHHHHHHRNPLQKQSNEGKKKKTKNSVKVSLLAQHDSSSVLSVEEKEKNNGNNDEEEEEEQYTTSSGSNSNSDSNDDDDEDRYRSMGYMRL